MDTRTSTTAVAPDDSAGLLDWIAVVASSIGCFMALMDISIVNTALPTIQGEIGASGTEGTWVTTSYIVAESIAIPLTGWLARIFGIRGLMIASIMMFTAFSIYCGFADSLTMMIIGRTGQGLSGGFLLPIVMLVIADRLPLRQQPAGFAMFGTTAVAGPVVGPLLGGWLTESAGWHYAFFINVPIGLLLTGLVFLSLPPSRFRPAELLDADWMGVFGLAIGLGCLTVVLEEGQREQWFESTMILWLSVAAIAGFIALWIGQMRSRRPVLKLGLMREWRFALVVILSLIGGACFYSASFLVPQFLGTVAGYNALESGTVMIFAALSSIVLMAAIPLLARTIPCPIIIITGMLLLSAACLHNAMLTDETGADAFRVSMLMHGSGTTMAMTFLTQLAVAIVPADARGDASALFNAARNLGGTFGLALIAVLQGQRLTLHHERLLETISANGQDAYDYLASLAPTAGGGESALRMFDLMVSRQALTMTYIDLFTLFGGLMLIAAPFALFLPRLPKGDHGPAH